MRRKFLPKLLIASIFVGGVNFVPAVVNFNIENLQIISVANAEVQNVTASDTAIFDFGENDAQIVDTVKNIAKMRAVKATKEKAGVLVKSFSKTVNGVLTDDDVSAYTSNNIEILDVKYKKIPIQAQDIKGNGTGKIAFMYEAIVTAKVDTDSLSEYLKLDYQTKQNIIQQDKISQKNIAEINSNFIDLRKNPNDIVSGFSKIDSKILAEQKFEKANKFYYKQNYQDAISIYSEIIEFEPYADVYNNRGVCYEELQNYEQAIKDFNKSIQIFSGNFEAYNNRGIVYVKLQNYEQAIKDFDKAIELNPNSPETYYNRGDYYGGLKKYDVAIKDFDKVIELNPNFAQAYFMRGVCYGGLKKYDIAIKDFDKTIELNPNFAKVYLMRGMFYGALGDMQKAKIDLQKAKELGYEF